MEVISVLLHQIVHINFHYYKYKHNTILYISNTYIEKIEAI